MHKIIKTPIPSETVRHSFFQLPDDLYLKSDFCYRQRRYSTGIFKNCTLQWNETNNAFLQSKSYNSLTGDVMRHFEPLTSSSKEYLAESIISSVTEHLTHDHFHIGAHQIRVHCDQHNTGYPAPEGIHQDGFDHIMVMSINTVNVVGGNSLLVKAHDHDAVILDYTLHPGEALLFCDKTYAHYASPIVPKLPNVAYRDVFVVTFSIIPKEKP